MQAYLLDVLKREARLVRNAHLFEQTAVYRVAIPEELAPEDLIREGRDYGFSVDRTGDPR